MANNSLQAFFQSQVRFLRRFTVKRRLLLTFLLISAAPLAIVATVSFYFSYKDATQKNETYSMQIINQIKINADAVASDYEKLLQTIVNEDLVQTDMKGAAELDKLGQYRLDDELKRMLNVKMMSNLSVEGITVALTNDQYSMYVGNRMMPVRYSGTRLYQETMNREGSSYLWMAPHLNEVKGFYQTGDKVLTLSIPIKDRWRGTNFGIAALAVKPGAFSEIMADGAAEDEGEVFILDDAGTVIYSDKESEWGEPLGDPKLAQALRSQQPELHHMDYEAADGRKYLTSFTRMSGTGWIIVKQVPYDYLMRSMNKILTFTIVTAVIIMLLSAYVATLVFNSIFSGIYKLMRSMRSLEKGDFQLSGVMPTGKDEIQQLTSAYDRMVNRLNDVINELYRAKVVKQAAQIKALKAQINPHFLYNTLETISSLAKIHGVRDISRMTSSLSHIFRYSITGEEDVVPLTDEIRSAEQYLRIIEIRHGDRMSFRIDVPESLRSCKVLKLILQPILENAVLHGIERKIGPGTIRIEAAEEGDRLRLSVQDNGAGMDAERLARMKALLSDVTEVKTPAAHGIGLLNVKERLWLVYQDQASFELFSIPGKGTTVTMTFPIERDEEGR